jgi:hypothetical protein
MLKPLNSTTSRRLRTQTAAGLIVFWILFTLAAVLIGLVHDDRHGWWVASTAIGWGAASVVRSMIDANYLIEEIKS